MAHKPKLPTRVPPSDETPRERFRRIGEPRVRNALNAIRLLGNLSSPRYEWHEDDIQKLRVRLNEQIEMVLGKFMTTDDNIRKVQEFIFEESTG